MDQKMNEIESHEKKNMMGMCHWHQKQNDDDITWFKLYFFVVFNEN